MVSLVCEVFQFRNSYLSLFGLNSWASRDLVRKLILNINIYLYIIYNYTYNHLIISKFIYYIYMYVWKRSRRVIWVGLEGGKEGKNDVITLWSQKKKKKTAADFLVLSPKRQHSTLFSAYCCLAITLSAHSGSSRKRTRAYELIKFREVTWISKGLPMLIVRHTNKNK